jgi:hypothetical protein
VPIRKSKDSGKAPRATKKSAKQGSARKKKRTAATDRKEKEELEPAAKRFVRDLLIRGEAARPTPEGDLPPGATHIIVEDDEDDGLPTVKRERFSLY